MTKGEAVSEEKRQSWLYMSGRHVSCRAPATLAFAMLQNINCEVSKKVDSRPLGLIKLNLLRDLRAVSPEAAYPGALDEEGDMEEVVAGEQLEEALALLAAAGSGGPAAQVDRGDGQPAMGGQVWASGAEARAQYERIHEVLARTQCADAFERACECAQSRFGTLHVYPHTFYGGFHFRRFKFYQRLRHELHPLPAAPPADCAGSGGANSDLVGVRERCEMNARKHALECLRQVFT